VYFGNIIVYLST